MSTVGVLCLQGDFERHGLMLESLGAKVVSVRSPAEIERIDALVMPGGESTTIGKLMNRFGLLDVIAGRISEGMPVFGTCAGLILLSKPSGDANQFRLGAFDIEVERNAYGRQVESFEADFEIPPIPGGPFRGVFIRAPIVRKVGGGVDVLASFEGNPVLLRQQRLLGASFHPELTGDSRVHRYFISMLEEPQREARS
jgi:pyridoxal 5'-phosphate synthase pdxT subunit